ncbi:MAG: glycosyltransferase family 25 protein [Rickettsiales bacterium]
MTKKIPNIDKIYFINMDKSIDRLKNVQNQCKAADIECSRFPAVNGYNVLIENSIGKSFFGIDLMNTKTQLPENQKFKITCDPKSRDITTYNIIGDSSVSAGQLGGWCSVIEIMKNAKRNNYKNILIFEDDIKIENPTNFANKVSNILSHTPKNFDFLFLGLSVNKGFLSPLKSNTLISSASNNFMGYGLHSYVVSNKGIEKFLSYDAYDFTAKDVFIWNHASTSDIQAAENSFECYASSENLVYQNYDFQSLLTEMGRTY